MLAMPMTREIEYDVKPKPFNVDVPLEKIYVPVPQDEKWWEHPALVAGGSSPGRWLFFKGQGREHKIFHH